MRCYAVFDTNVLVSSLLTKNPDSATAKVVDAISSDQIILLYNEEILAEYDVLHRIKFPFSVESVTGLLKMVKQFGIAVSPSPTGEILTDIDDLVFYGVVIGLVDMIYILILLWLLCNRRTVQW